MASTAFPDLPAARRRALSRQVRDGFPPMGVYAVRNLASGEVRVSASRNVPGALNRLRFELRMNQHRDRVLQQAWNAAGSDNVTFDVLEMVRERPDPAFDHDTELQALLELWTAEVATTGAAK
ncbi:MAG TPA: GIY-YIG nuclease family protein [Ramlibacter sp.]|nr:GIY-YIG nuclease family protein [Ramlibacter sp.]